MGVKHEEPQIRGVFRNCELLAPEVPFEFAPMKITYGYAVPDLPSAEAGSDGPAARNAASRF